MSAKQPVDPAWLKQLHYSASHAQRYRDLLAGMQAAEKVVSFGLFQKGREPFYLMWLLNAAEISVVEIKQEYIDEFKRLITEFRDRTPEGFQGRTIKPVVADMAQPVTELAGDYFDLAFCDNVLYSVNRNQPDLERVGQAIHEMARVIRPGGTIVAYEPQMGWQPNVMTYTTQEISPLFEQAGLTRHRIDASLPYLYVFKKPASRKVIVSPI
jgi:hypothetical protein